MATSLYDMSVASYLQTTMAVAGYLDKGLVFCREEGINTTDIVDARLFPDMLPFRFQIVSVAHHSLDAVQGLKKGVFTPPGQTGPQDYPGLQQLIADAVTGLQGLSPTEVNALEGREIVIDRSPSRPKTSSSRFRSPISISTPRPPMTSYAPRVCHSASAISSASFA